ncbi:hypothetical protein CPB83DRAFT_854486 [Crepidotus variabilis]|uniref:protein-tyrosine-phosphatase n=1 Tax=Crepidotus variabilis TaxID=179855 RepID=A0A9P6EFX5_9AGAR|nr:hypothetical protein CPB83DRAFT_854486 [Crepidotus variabilis]
MSMNEVVSKLWIGDLKSAMNVRQLKENGIFSVFSAMRGRITIHETFVRHQIQLDDSEDEDILIHFLPAIHFIQAELDKGRGVLVHCQAGISRSATIVAAYLMYSRNLDRDSALKMIRQVRPFADPNANFYEQLELFHKAQYKISRKDKDIRMFYMGRAVEEIMNGDGTQLETDMFARLPQESPSSTPGPVPRRRIRCKMCRQELALREHMLDHGQLGPATPPLASPAISRRPSSSVQPATATPLPGGSIVHVPGRAEPKRRPSGLSSVAAFGDSLSMSSIRDDSKKKSDSALDTDEEPDSPRKSSNATQTLQLNGEGATEEDIAAKASRVLGRRLSGFVRAGTSESGPANKKTDDSFFIAEGDAVATHSPKSAAEDKVDHAVTHLKSPSDLASQLFANPKLAALRSQPPTPGAQTSPTFPRHQSGLISSAPILANPLCSGYFVEPMKWMEHFLSAGQLAGKVSCPNKKCGAKLGNYDWAGVRCGCNEWVTPGFCINRSKVDEVV